MSDKPKFPRALAKLVVNNGVREALADLDRLFTEFEQTVVGLSRCGPEGDLTLGRRKMDLEKTIVGVAARLVSHATSGKRFPHMTPEYGR